MSVGPVQLIVLGFEGPDFRGEIIDELQRLGESGTVRVVDSLIVYRDTEGDIAILTGTNMPADEQPDRGSYVAALLGLDEEESAAEEDLDDDFEYDEDIWDVLAEIPNDTAAALVLLDHQWAVPLRNAITNANGFLLGEGFLSPDDLGDIGLIPSTAN